MKFSKWFPLAAAIITVVTIGVSQPALAQGGFPGRPSIDAQAFNACTTTDYASLIAKSLNMSVVDLRKDIVSGKALQDVVASANVDPQTILSAYMTARKADIDQAVKDAVLTQDEANAIETVPTGPGTPPAGPQGTRPAPQGQSAGGPSAQAAVPFPDISTIRLLLVQASGTQPAPGGGGRGGFGGGIGFGAGAGIFNLVKQYEVAAQALNMKCTDLVKTLITPPGKSIVAVAADQKVDPQTVADALTKAYKDALAQDVTDGVITQDQSTKVSANLDKTVMTFINNALVMGRQGPPATATQ